MSDLANLPNYPETKLDVIYGRPLYVHRTLLIFDILGSQASQKNIVDLLVLRKIGGGWITKGYKNSAITRTDSNS